MNSLSYTQFASLQVSMWVHLPFKIIIKSLVGLYHNRFIHADHTLIHIHIKYDFYFSIVLSCFLLKFAKRPVAHLIKSHALFGMCVIVLQIRAMSKLISTFTFILKQIDFGMAFTFENYCNNNNNSTYNRYAKNAQS